MNGLILLTSQDKIRAVEEASILREYLSSCDQSSGRNRDEKGHSDEVSDREKAIFNIRCPRAWLNCVHALVLCGRYNL